jgi:hypothetical protein
MHIASALETLQRAVEELRACDPADLDEPELADSLRQLRTAMHGQEEVFSRWSASFARRGVHLLDGAASAVSWIRGHCKMSAAAAADRLCVGRQLERMPEVARALAGGEIGFQSASVLCHLREQLGEKGDDLDEGALVQAAMDFNVHDLSILCRRIRHQVDPEGFDRGQEEDFSRRWLRVSSMMDGMYAIDGVLDQAGGAAVRTALNALNRPVGGDDGRTLGQRNADALVELTHRALDQGTLPRRNGVRPHVGLTTTLETLKGEVGAPAAEMELGVPISFKTLERLTCDCTISRILLQDSAVIDVGRATRIVSEPTRRALQVRDRHCRWPGCDRPIGWTSPHHVIYWARGGPSRLGNLLSLCYVHHRNVHEGGWQVVAHGNEFRFLPPDPQRFTPGRGPGWRNRWAA